MDVNSSIEDSGFDKLIENKFSQSEIDNNNESDQMSENDVNSEINSTIVSNQPYDEALSDFSDYEMDDVADTDDMDANSDPR